MRALRAEVRSGLWAALVCAVLLLSLAAGCGHHRQKAVVAAGAPPPPLRGSHTDEALPPNVAKEAAGLPRTAPVEPANGAPGVTTAADLAFVKNHPAIWSETGKASWYGPPYNKRRGANGQIFDQDAMTAAHRTLPMNSLVRVTNLTNGKSAVMRITDRGPFVPGRILDLSLASAKEIGVWAPGTATVRVEAFAVPSPIATGGRWCVQIGAFKNGGEAEKLRDHLRHRYRTANVIEFTGPTGHWVRIRPTADAKERAVEIAKDLHPAEGEAYLVRLD